MNKNNLNKNINNIIQKYLTYSIQSLKKFKSEIILGSNKIFRLKKIDILDVFIKLLQNGYNAISIPYKYNFLIWDIADNILDINKKYNLEIKNTIKFEEMSMIFVYYVDINNDNTFKSYDVLLLDITIIEDYKE